MQTTAEISFEIELSLIGSVTRYHPATYSSPADGGEVEDCDIENIGIIELAPAPEREKYSHPRGLWKTTSILDGIDKKNPEIQKLFANILAMRSDEASEAVYDAGFE